MNFHAQGVLKPILEKQRRLNEHATADTKSEVYKHMNSCKQFKYLTNLLELNTDEYDNEQFDMTSFLLNNSCIVDRAQHWLNLLFNEALAIC